MGFDIVICNSALVHSVKGVRTLCDGMVIREYDFLYNYVLFEML